MALGKCSVSLEKSVSMSSVFNIYTTLCWGSLAFQSFIWFSGPNVQWTLSITKVCEN